MVLPHQQLGDSIADAFQPEIKTHISNVQKVLQRILLKGGQPADAAKRAGEMFDSVNEKIYKRIDVIHPDDRDLMKIDCKAGCAYCCSVPVQTYPQEVELLARELKAKLGPEELTLLKSKIQNVLDGRKAGKRPRCALLGPDNLCTVYPIRPLLCRSCNSPDVEECKLYEEGDDTPRRVFALPGIFATFTHFATNTSLNPDLNPHTYPEPGELMEMLLKAL